MKIVDNAKHLAERSSQAEKAIETANPGLLATALLNGVDPNQPLAEGDTLLHRACAPDIPVIDYFVTVKVDPIKHPCIYKCFLGHEMVHARMCKKLGMKFYSLNEAQTEIPAYQWEVGCYIKLQMDAGLGPYKKEQ